MEQLHGDKDADETVEEKIDRLGKEVEDLEEQVERLRNSLPPITRPPVPEPLLKLRHAIKAKDTERELLLEDQRASRVVEDYLHENPFILETVDDCPICLDPIFDIVAALTFICCGNKLCRSCAEPLRRTAIDTCPLCREMIPSQGEELRILRAKAAAGKAWAQCSLGNKHCHGLLGLAVDKQKGEHLYRRAADQGYSHAQYYLGRIEGERGNGSGACRLFEAAASQGHMNALGFLGIGTFLHYHDGDGVEKDDVKAVRLLTVSSKLQTAGRFAHAVLATCFASGKGGLKRSMVRSVHYLKPAVEISEWSPEYLRTYAAVLHALSASYYPDYEIPPSGDNAMPEALFWYRRAHSTSVNAESVKCLEAYESSMKELCGCCYRTLSTDEPKCCLECKAVYYCSRECQAADWKAGHKKDCVKALKKRLRATGMFNDI